MSTLNSPDYYRRRMAQSQERAALAFAPEVRAIHQELALRYADLIQASEREGTRPALRLILPA